METLPISIYCPHCKMYTSLTPALRTVERRRTLQRSHEEFKIRCVWEKQSNDIWWIGICNSCKNPVLVHNEGDIVYPYPLPSPSDERIPEDIRKDLDEAKKCFSVGAYRACAVMASDQCNQLALIKIRLRIDLWSNFKG